MQSYDSLEPVLKTNTVLRLYAIVAISPERIYEGHSGINDSDSIKLYS